MRTLHQQLGLAQSESNIRILDSKYKILDRHFASKEDANDRTPSLGSTPSGLTPPSAAPAALVAGLRPLATPDCSQQDFGPPARPNWGAITYAKFSIKDTADSTRIEVNADLRFASDTEPGFKKIKFSLTDRRREFFANLKWRAWPEYELCHAMHQASTHRIGKACVRKRYSKKGPVSAPIMPYTAMWLDLKTLTAHVWILDEHFEFQFRPQPVEHYPYVWEYKPGTSDMADWVTAFN